MESPAIQMDIKIHGPDKRDRRGSDPQDKRGKRVHPHRSYGKNVFRAPRDHVNKYAPKIIQIQIDPQKIGDVVGQRGKTINTIIERTGVQIDISDDGAVSICGR